MKRRQRGTAILETVLLWAVVITMTLAVGTEIQKGQTRLINSTLTPLFSALDANAPVVSIR